MKALARSTTQENRRGFVRHCFGVGASLAALPFGSSQAMGSRDVPMTIPIVPRMSEYERILSHTGSMQVLGNPRSWSLVSQGLHPFAPERVAILPTDYRIRYGDRCGKDLRRKIEERLNLESGHLEGYDQRWFPTSKWESIYWIMETMTSHYHVSPQFQEWVVGLAGREILGSSGYCGMGLAHQYQRGGPVPVDSPPVDWWLFLFPGGIDWAALDEQRIYAVIAHVRENDPTWSDMYPNWALTREIWRTVRNWSHVAHVGRVGACRHLNGITAQCLANKAR
jgi:hypothetical protein